jgi:hypothetical protein
LRTAHVEADALVQAVEAGSDPDEILRHAVQELAVEAAAIRYEIVTAHEESRVDQVPQKMTARISALAKMASITLERHKLGMVEIDLRSLPVQKVFELFVEAIEHVADSTLESSAEFMKLCKEQLQGWEDRVE